MSRIGHLLRTMKLLHGERRLPRWLLLLLGLAALPIPGPVDEVLLVIAAGIVFAVPRYRRAAKLAWSETCSSATDDELNALGPSA